MLNLTKDNFETEALRAKEPVVVDFWASWCGPCMMLKPVFEELSAEMPEMKFAKVNVDDERELAIRYGVQSIPTLLVLKNGEVAKTLVGYREKDTLRAELEAVK